MCYHLCTAKHAHIYKCCVFASKSLVCFHWTDSLCRYRYFGQWQLIFVTHIPVLSCLCLSVCLSICLSLHSSVCFFVFPKILLWPIKCSLFSDVFLLYYYLFHLQILVTVKNGWYVLYMMCNALITFININLGNIFYHSIYLPHHKNAHVFISYYDWPFITFYLCMPFSCSHRLWEVT